MYKLSIENEIANLSRVASFLEITGLELNLSRNDIFDINLILDELITNVITYGFNDNRRHKIDISIEKKDSSIVLIITDDGIPFNPAVLEEADVHVGLKDRKIGGLGVHLVKHKSAALKYKREYDKNIVEIIKELYPEK